MVLRLFAALVPPAPVLDGVEHATAELRGGALQGLRWVPRENLHVTLAFYGPVPDGALPDVVDALADRVAATPPPTLHLSGAGAFSGRTLWLGVGGEVARLRDLMADAAAVLADERDDGPARPHVTIARSGRRSRGLDLGRVVRALAVYRGPDWRAETVTLLSSHLGEGRGGAPRYEVEAEVPLGG